MIIVCFGYYGPCFFCDGFADNDQWLVVGCDDEQQEMHGCDWFVNPSAFLELIK
jgi:hypothetical protein